MIVLASDHAGFPLKEEIKAFLTEKGVEFIDCGTDSTASVDYAAFAQKACLEVVNGNADKAILCCGTGIGISMAANKVKGIRAAHVTDTYSARMAKEHNNAQIICLGERITGPDLALEIVKSYLSAKHLGGRHENRVNKIMALEK